MQKRNNLKNYGAFKFFFVNITEQNYPPPSKKPKQNKNKTKTNKQKKKR